MKRFASRAVLALFVAVSLPVAAQTEAQRAGSSAMDAQSRQEPTRQEPKGAVPAARARARPAADARHCLQFTTNVEIVRCAERYL